MPHPVDCWVQLREASLAELVEVGDGLLRRTRPLLSLNQVSGRLQELAGVAGVKAARAALRWLVPGTDSLYETRLRLVLMQAGLPQPVVNHPVYCASTDITYHLDMAYVAEQVAVEFDGADHVGSVRQMNIDADRRRNLQDEGWTIITVTAPQVGRPRAVIRSVEQALILRRARATQANDARRLWS